jgi:hypothetical protein
MLWWLVSRREDLSCWLLELQLSHNLDRLCL